MNLPLVSAVIPTYNYAQYLPEAVESALAQTYPNMEVIVVDDGSTDRTRECLAPYRERIAYIYQPNRGLSAARNTGIAAARGEWIALLDSDDTWHPEKTALQLRAAEGMDHLALVGSPPADRMPEHLAPPVVRVLEVRDFLLNVPLGPSSALIRRRCLEDVGLFDESLTSVEDRDMWLRLSARFGRSRF